MNETSPINLFLNADIKKAGQNLKTEEARILVDAYYQMQKDRIRSSNRVFSMSEEPHLVLSWLRDQNHLLEDSIKKVLDSYSGTHPVGSWSRSIKGIGPVLAAGLLAYIDIERAPYVGYIWSYAGYNPNVVWENEKKTVERIKNSLEGFNYNDGIPYEELPAIALTFNRNPTNFVNNIKKLNEGELKETYTISEVTKMLTKRPWNSELKTLCWKIGESFVKAGKDSEYNLIYNERKALESKNNIEGKYKEQALNILESKNIGKSTKAFEHYSNGILPPAHIHARAKRYAVKLFLAHWHHVAFFNHYRKDPPKPYILDRSEIHNVFIAPPNFDKEKWFAS